MFATPRKSLSILILGGSGFIGRQQLGYALSRGHRVTIFNRGRQLGALPESVECLIGDRETGDYAALAGRSFDARIDNACSLPHWVRDAADVLAGKIAHYVFISTVSVYAESAVMGADETAARERLIDHVGADAMRIRRADLLATPSLYGALKARCEDEVHARYPGAACVIRPGLIVGPGDATERFTYWPVRIAQGGAVLVPPRADPVQLIDVRDVAEWTIRLAERRTLGDFNAIGPQHELSMGALIDAIMVATDSRAECHEASLAFLNANKVRAWQDLPLWVSGEGSSAGFHRRSHAKAIREGLTFRPIATTIADTLNDWLQAGGGLQRPLKAGLTREQQAALLRKLGSD
jgi:2'-hydroxyisoflavone reductase